MTYGLNEITIAKILQRLDKSRIDMEDYANVGTDDFINFDENDAFIA